MYFFWIRNYEIRLDLYFFRSIMGSVEKAAKHVSPMEPQYRQ